jgi:YD repeat-containing protein
MKTKSLFFFAFLLLCGACSKEDQQPTEDSKLVCTIFIQKEGMEKGNSYNSFVYDENDMLVEEKFHAKDGSILIRYTYEYDGGRLTKKTTTSGNLGSFVTIYEYDASGNLILERTTGDACLDVRYEYDGTLLVKETVGDCGLAPNSVAWYIEYEYDDQKRKIKESRYEPDGNLSYGFVYEYENDRLSKRYVFYEPNDIVFDFEYIYDGNGNLIKEASNTYEYDEFNRLIRTELFYGDYSATKTYEYCD